jgi:hypothetical protein
MEGKQTNGLLANFFSGQQFDQFLHSGGKDAALAMDKGEGSVEILVFELNDFE